VSEADRFVWNAEDVEIEEPEAEDGEEAEGTKALKLAADPRDSAERRLRDALVAMFERVRPEVARKIAAGEPVADDELAEAFRAVLQPNLTQTATEEGLRLGAEIGVQFDPAVVNSAAAEWAKDYSYELVKGITGTTQKIIAEATSAFVSTPGMTIGQLESLLEPAYGPVRAQMIAVTETSRAYSESTNHYQRQLDSQGIKLQRVWVTSADEIAMECPICWPKNQRPESEWAEEFPSGPPGHVNCRCHTNLRPVKGKQK
jgi:hypothetical protein